MAAKAFRHTAVYDTHIAGYLGGAAEEFPEQLTIALAKVQDSATVRIHISERRSIARRHSH